MVTKWLSFLLRNKKRSNRSFSKGDVYKPTKDGVILYFKTDSIENTQKGSGIWRKYFISKKFK
jgi:hypothetical protein